MSPENERLLYIAEAVSDAEAVDWSEAQAKASDPEERELVRLLRDISYLTEIQRTRTKHPEHVSATPHMPQEPRASASVWGQLQLGAKLGEGAAAEVFRARDSTLDRDVALKLFRHDDRIGPAQRHALLLEGRNLAQLRHENVVTVLGAADHDGRVGIWMELVEGRTLSEIVNKEGPFSASEATQMGIELCGALAAVHRKQLVHGDIKGQNVKREDGGRIVLMDFSSSRGADESPGNPDSDPAGTPLYMAPELWEGETPHPDSDIYALGVLLYYLVTNEFPVRGTSIESLRRAHEDGERHLLRDERPGLPDVFVRAVEKALRQNPKERFASAGAMEEALRELVAPVPKTETLEREAATPAPLPIEVRVIARLARAGTWVLGITAALTGLGFLTSAALNTVLGRSALYAQESVFDWFIWGLRSLIGPTYHIVVTVLPFLFVAFGLWLVTKIPPAERFLSMLRVRASTACDRNLGTITTIALIAGLVTICGLVSSYYDLIDAIQSQMSGDVDRAKIALLNPENQPYHLAYRRHFTLLSVGLIATLIWLPKRWRKAEQLLGNPTLLGLIALTAVSVVLMELPWQILWQTDFPRVQYRNERCYVIGTHSEESLLFCPFAVDSKTRLVDQNNTHLISSGIIESIFTSDSPSE